MQFSEILQPAQSFVCYIWKLDGKTYNATLEHLIISAFTVHKATQCRQHCAP